MIFHSWNWYPGILPAEKDSVTPEKKDVRPDVKMLSRVPPPSCHLQGANLHDVIVHSESECHDGHVEGQLGVKNTGNKHLIMEAQREVSLQLASHLRPMIHCK